MSVILRRLAVAVIPLLLVLSIVAPRAAAVGWAEIPSGTGEDITAIEYQGADRFWFTTSNGKIFKRQADGGFTQVYSAPGVVLTALDFQPGGPVGLAVGSDGKVRRTTDNGDTWAVVTLPNANSSTSANRCDIDGVAPGALESVRFQGSTRAWIAGWDVPNDNGATCKIEKDVDDFAPIDGADAVYFVSVDFGAIRYSADALATPAASRAGSGNGFTQRRRLAIDPLNPNRQWSVAPNGAGGSYANRTANGWSTAETWNTNGTVSLLQPLQDVAYNGGTVLAAGSSGQIVSSTDGTNFGASSGGAALAAQEWLAVALASATQGAVGGRSGKLVISTDTDVVPVPPATTPPTTTTPPATSPPTTRPPTTTTTTTRLPAPTFGAGASSPPLVGGAAIVEGKRVVLRVRGTLGLPTGISRRTACTGRIRVAVIKGKGKTAKILKSKRIKVRSNCRYAGKITVLRRKVGSATRLRMRVVFPGNSVLRRVGQTYAIRVRPAS